MGDRYIMVGWLPHASVASSSWCVVFVDTRFTAAVCVCVCVCVWQHKGDDDNKRRTKTNDDSVCVPCSLHLSSQTSCVVYTYLMMLLVLFTSYFLKYTNVCRYVSASWVEPVNAYVLHQHRRQLHRDNQDLCHGTHRGTGANIVFCPGTFQGSVLIFEVRSNSGFSIIN